MNAQSRRPVRPPDLLQRGVYTAPYLTASGKLEMFAVTAAGRLAVKPVRVSPIGDADAVRRQLWRELVEVDPVQKYAGPERRQRERDRRVLTVDRRRAPQ